MAQYKTIILELLQQEYPALHERLRASRSLLSAVNDYSMALRNSHLKRIEELREANPGYDPAQLSSEALEMAINQLREEALPSESPTDGEEAFSLDAAMSYIRRHTPPA